MLPTIYVTVAADAPITSMRSALESQCRIVKVEIAAPVPSRASALRTTLTMRAAVPVENR
jgi:hypothetical protein